MNIADHNNKYDLSDIKNVSLFASRFITGLILAGCIKGFKRQLCGHMRGALDRCAINFEKISSNRFKTGMAENLWLAVFIVTCALGLAVVLDLFQLHVHSGIPCICSLPTDRSPEVFNCGTFAQGD